MNRQYSLLALLAVIGIGSAFFITREAPPLTSVATAKTSPAPASALTSEMAPNARSASSANACPVILVPKPLPPIIHPALPLISKNMPLIDPSKMIAITHRSVAEVFPGLQLPVANWKTITPAELRVSPYPGVEIPFKVASQETTAQRSIWTGRNSIQGASLTYAATEKFLDAVVTIPQGNQYMIHVTNEGATVVENFDENQTCGAADQGSNEITLPVPMADTPGTTIDGPVFTVDILVVYTTKSLGEFWGKTPEEVMNKYAAWCATANTYYVNSLVTNLRVNVVGVMEAVGYDASLTTNMNDDLNAISYDATKANATVNPNGTAVTSNIFKLVDAKKKELKADYVQFMVDGTKSSAGLAWVNWCYSTINSNCGVNTMAHELGHNMGCAHDRKTDSAVDNTTTTGPYNYGFMYQGTYQVATNYSYKTTIGTVMSYAGSRLPYFSNPNVNYTDPDPTVGVVALGVAVDQPKAAYNAKVLTDSAMTNAATIAGANDPIVTKVTSDKTENVGYYRQSITLTELATGANLKYQWYKDKVDNSTIIHTPIPKASSSTYTIASFAESDVGSYYVVVWNATGAAQTEKTIISGREAPVIIPPVTSTPSESGSTGGGGGGGGGGAPSDWFFGALAILVGARSVRKAVLGQREIELD